MALLYVVPLPFNGAPYQVARRTAHVRRRRDGVFERVRGEQFVAVAREAVG